MNKNLKLIHIIKDNNINENIITSIGIFPSGNFICVSSDKSAGTYKFAFMPSHKDKSIFSRRLPNDKKFCLIIEKNFSLFSSKFGSSFNLNFNSSSGNFESLPAFVLALLL